MAIVMEKETSLSKLGGKSPLFTWFNYYPDIGVATVLIPRKTPVTLRKRESCQRSDMHF